MIITCPSCQSRYNVDPSAFTSKARTVRCANCGHRWKASPPIDAPKTVEMEPEPETTSPDRDVPPAAATIVAAKQRSPKAEQRSSGSPIGWMLGGGVVILVLVSLVIGRNGIVDKVPAAAAIYQSVGLSIDQDIGLEFEDVTVNWQAEGDVIVLVVEGEIVNLSEASRIIPPLRMAILGRDGEELQHESIEIAENELSAGNRVNFSGRMVNPIEKGENFRLTFDLES